MGIADWPNWLQTVAPMVLKITIILALAPVGMMYLTWFERKVIARLQDRFGPNRVGPYGLFQPLADGIKMLTKEDLVPEGADRLCHFLAPIIIVVPALYLFTVLPFGQNAVAVSLTTGLLFFVAVGSTESLAIFMAAWGSRNKFALFGALRNAAQVVAYEIPVILALVVIPMMSGSLNLVEIVQAQAQWNWFILTPWGFVSFVLVFVGGLAEVNRTPFDMAEAESELVGGFHTEYSGMKFALFYMAEFLSTLALAALLATLFLGGWHGFSFLPEWAWVGIKTMGLVFVMVWIRGTWPRFRIDQLLGFAWKVMIPLSLVNVLGAAVCTFIPGWRGNVIAVIGILMTFLVTTQLWLRPAPKLPGQWVKLI